MNSWRAAESMSMMNWSSPGAAPSTSSKTVKPSASIQLNANCGGPVVGISSPAAVIGRTEFGGASTSPAAIATPSTSFTRARSASLSDSTEPNVSIGRTSRSVLATMSWLRSPKVARKPSPSTNAETTKLTASTTPNVVIAKRPMLARRLRRVSLVIIGLVLSFGRARRVRWVAPWISRRCDACAQGRSGAWGRSFRRQLARQPERRSGRRNQRQWDRA